VDHVLIGCMKVLFTIILFYLVCLPATAQEKEKVVSFAKKYSVPLHYYNNEETFTDDEFKKTAKALSLLKKEELNEFIKFIPNSNFDETVLRKFLNFCNTANAGDKLNFNNTLISYGDIKKGLSEQFKKISKVGEINVDILTPISTENPVIEAPVKAVTNTDQETPPSIDCKAELTKSLEGFLTENRTEFLQAQYRITSLKLAIKTKGSNKATLEEVVKTEKAGLQNIKNSEESSNKLKELYKTYGFADDSKAITEVEKLTNKTNSLNYYKGTQRLLNDDLSAYILANVADSKNTLFDETDAATAWLFDEMQKKYVDMGNKKFGAEFNLMNLSSSSYLLANSLDENKKPIDLDQSLSDSEKIFTDAYADFLGKFKEEKKVCFEKGQAFEGECDQEILGLIEEGFTQDLKNIVKGMISDTLKPEFNTGKLKIADSEIAFKDLLSTDVSKISMKAPAPSSNTNERTPPPMAKSSATKPTKEISEKEFKSELYRALNPQGPLSLAAFNQQSKIPLKNQELLTTNVGKCEIKVKRLFDGKTRIEMNSPVNKVSYNVTLNTALFMSPSIPTKQIANALDQHYNKPHIRNSCLAN
jgi:hypothetical protein